MDKQKELNDPFVQKDLRMLGITLFIVALLFAGTALLDAKTEIVSKISRNLYLATLNNK